MNKQGWTIVLFSIGVFMAALDNGIISAALTTIYHDFGVSPNWGAWTVTIYTLGLAISIPIIGKLSDRYGRKKLFLIEISIFALGSLFVALSPSFGLLLVSRLIQALGGGGIFVIASSHVLSTFPKEAQGKALGALGGMNGIAAVLGPNVGSFILDMTGNWHWLFLINLPIAAALLVLGWMFISESREPETAGLDFGGIIALSLSILAFMYGLTNIGGADLLASVLDPNVYGFVLGGIVLFLLLIWIERRVEQRAGDPILPLKLMRQPHYLLTLLLGAFSGVILASVIFLPAYVEQVLGVAASKAGYFFTPLALASGIGAGGGGALADRKGPIFTMVAASIIACIGALLFPLWVNEIWQMFTASCILGLGFGMMLGAPINMLATERTADNKGVALGTMSLFRQIGMTIGPAIYAGFLARSFTGLGDRIAANLEEAGVHASAAPAGMIERMEEMNYQDMMAQLERIPVPVVRDTLVQTIQDAVQSGFNKLYLTTAVFAACTLLATVILHAIRRRPEPVSIAEPNDRSAD